MATIISRAFLFLVVAAPALAANYDVNWSAGTDYSGWAAGKSIAVGDTITFLYGGFHTVDEVSQTEYESCSSSSSLSSHSEGNTVFTLDKEGTRYFICAAAGHCQSGMKIAVTVAGGGAAAVTPPISAGDSPAETPLTPPAPPSSSGEIGAAAVSLPARKVLLGGLVLAGLVALG